MVPKSSQVSVVMFGVSLVWIWWFCSRAHKLPKNLELRFLKKVWEDGAKTFFLGIPLEETLGRRQYIDYSGDVLRQSFGKMGIKSSSQAGSWHLTYLPGMLIRNALQNSWKPQEEKKLIFLFLHAFYGFICPAIENWRKDRYIDLSRIPVEKSGGKTA